MTDRSHALHPLIAEHVERALKSLLSEKHLYQSVEVPKEYYDKLAETAADSAATQALQQPSIATGRPSNADTVRQRTLEDYQASIREAFSVPWITRQSVVIGDERIPITKDEIVFNVPDIRTFCSVCKEIEPFNPNPDIAWGGLPTLHHTWELPTGTGWQLHPHLQARLTKLRAPVCRQLFVIPYQCQGCKKEPIVFLVRREGLKLTLCGRSQIEIVPVPKDLPEAFRKFYSDAHIAHHAGQTLAGIFLLRVFIEQFWRSLLERNVIVAGTPGARISGEELGSAYNETLPTDFKSYFPSLTSVYAKLSECMHAANPDATVFDSAAEDIVRHFEARRIRKIDNLDEVRASNEKMKQSNRSEDQPIS